MLDFRSFEVVTFDCYGTLIDWEAGIWNALSPVFLRHHVDLNPQKALELYADLESAIEKDNYRPYREVLENVLLGFGKQLQFIPSPAEVSAFPESIRDWPVFPDTIAALKSLKEKYRLAVISNIDDDLFAYTARILQVPFDDVITARQVESYKPSLNNFRRALERLQQPPEKVLHVAQSLYHDIAPAKALGFSTVWVNRRHDKPGFGATPPAQATPDIEVPDLKTLAKMVEETFY